MTKRQKRRKFPRVRAKRLLKAVVLKKHISKDKPRHVILVTEIDGDWQD